MNRPDRVVTILGMHRSGTSCLTGSLQACGLELGKFHASNKHNKKGNRENQDIIDLHEGTASAGAPVPGSRAGGLKRNRPAGTHIIRPDDLHGRRRHRSNRMHHRWAGTAIGDNSQRVRSRNRGTNGNGRGGG